MKNEMKALSKLHAREGLWMTHAPVPEIGPEDVLIRINATGICGTDIHIWNWDEWAQKTVPVPLITGHEFAGEIVEIGRNVEGLEIGHLTAGQRGLADGAKADVIRPGLTCRHAVMTRGAAVGPDDRIRAQLFARLAHRARAIGQMHAVQPVAFRQQDVVVDHDRHVALVADLAQGVGGAGDLSLVVAGQGQADTGDLGHVKDGTKRLGKVAQLKIRGRNQIDLRLLGLGHGESP